MTAIGRVPKRIVDAATISFVAGLLALVYVLPPDTSLSEIQRIGLLKVCVPPSYPPLVTDDPDAPGFEVELLEEIAQRLDLRLVLSVNSAINADFNPANWRVTRAQCQVIAGGIAATELTRSFLDTTEPHLDTGWVLIGEDPGASLSGRTVGFFAGLSGRDRLALGRTLRSAGATVRLLQSREDLANAIASNEVDVGITDALAGRQIANERDWTVIWLYAEWDRDPIAFGLWKGDVTLKRALVATIGEIEAEGRFEELGRRYGIGPIEGTYSPPGDDK